MLTEQACVRRMKPCGLCGREIKLGERVVRFNSQNGSRFTTRDNLCVQCMYDIAHEEFKKKREDIIIATNNKWETKADDIR